MIAFEGYEAEDYERITPDLAGFETLQADLLGNWLVEQLNPNSVVDFGCGAGMYLTPFQKAGAWVLGIDALKSPREGTNVPKFQYMQLDLRRPILLPDVYISGSKYQLAICLEVAEHLHEEYLDTLFDSLERHADMILFSGATPGQGGTNHHSERPTEFWLGMFRDRGYELHPLNGELQEFLQSLTPLREQSKVCGWLIDHTFLLSK